MHRHVFNNIEELTFIKGIQKSSGLKLKMYLLKNQFCAYQHNTQGLKPFLMRIEIYLDIF